MLYKPCLVALLSLVLAGPTLAKNSGKLKIAVVSSYHPEYIWSQETNKGLIQAMLDFAYLDNPQQGETYTRTNTVESSKVILQKYWMDSKRKNSQREISKQLKRISQALDDFNPDLLLLGDDNAANYIGNRYLDTATPIVFWGVNGTPLKYGLLDSIESPGHNITGVYQAGYHLEGVKQLQRLLPEIQSIGVLADSSPTGRSHAKKIKRYGDENKLPVKVVKVVMTNSYEQWKEEALQLSQQVDAFFMSNHNTLEDRNGNDVNYLQAAAWFLENIDKPCITPARFMVEEGFLAAVDDSAFKQAYEAMRIAHQIISENKNPAEIASYAPERGPFLINRWRARKLNIEQRIEQHKSHIDEFIEDSAAWDFKDKR